MLNFQSPALILLLILTAGCARPEGFHAVSAGQPPEGTYAGLLPCADCPGIQTRMTFSGDGAVVVASRYEDRGDAVFTDRGTWREANGLITATFGTERRYYKIKDGSKIALVDAEGRESSTLPGAYILTRQK